MALCSGVGHSHYPGFFSGVEGILQESFSTALRALSHKALTGLHCPRVPPVSAPGNAIKRAVPFLGPPAREVD